MILLSRFSTILLLLLVILPSARLAHAGEARLPVAILSFENHSGDPASDPFRLGLRDMLTTDLSRLPSLQIVERGRLEEVIKELSLAEGKFIDPATAAKLGKGVGAKALIAGSFILTKDKARIDLRMVESETGTVLLAESAEGPKDDFFAIEKELAEKAIARLSPQPLGRAELTAVRAPHTQDFEAFKLYSESIAALEAGDPARAKQGLEAAIRRDAGFKLAQDGLGRIEAALRQQMLEDAAKMKGDAGKILVGLAEHAELVAQRARPDNPNEADRLASMLILSVHAGLAGRHEDEIDWRRRCWRSLTAQRKPTDADTMCGTLRKAYFTEYGVLCNILRGGKGGDNLRNLEITGVIKAAGLSGKLFEPSIDVLQKTVSSDGHLWVAYNAFRIVLDPTFDNSLPALTFFLQALEYEPLARMYPQLEPFAGRGRDNNDPRNRKGLLILSESLLEYLDPSPSIVLPAARGAVSMADFPEDIALSMASILGKIISEGSYSPIAPRTKTILAYMISGLQHKVWTCSDGDWLTWALKESESLGGKLAERSRDSVSALDGARGKPHEELLRSCVIFGTAGMLRDWRRQCSALLSLEHALSAMPEAQSVQLAVVALSESPAFGLSNPWDIMALDQIKELAKRALANGFANSASLRESILTKAFRICCVNLPYTRRWNASHQMLFAKLLARVEKLDRDSSAFPAHMQMTRLVLLDNTNLQLPKNIQMTRPQAAELKAVVDRIVAIRREMPHQVQTWTQSAVELQQQFNRMSATMP